MAMHAIDVDFEVLKALMARRATEDVTNNDVIRGLLDLPVVARESAAPATSGGLEGRDFETKGVRFPAGTEFRGTHHGRVVGGCVENGQLVVNGEQHNSLSSAAHYITKYAVNGWDFWEYRVPGGEWRPASAARRR